MKLSPTRRRLAPHWSPRPVPDPGSDDQAFQWTTELPAGASSTFATAPATSPFAAPPVKQRR